MLPGQVDSDSKPFASGKAPALPSSADALEGVIGERLEADAVQVEMVGLCGVEVVWS